MSEKPCLMKYTAKGFYNSNRYFQSPTYLVAKATTRQKTSPHDKSAHLVCKPHPHHNIEDLFANGSFYFIESCNNLKTSEQNANATSMLASSSPIPFFNQSTSSMKPKAPNNSAHTAVGRTSVVEVGKANGNFLMRDNTYVPSFSRFWKDLQYMKTNDPKLRSNISFTYFS